MADDVDARLERLLDEADDIRALNDGRGHENPEFLKWRSRVEVAVTEKLGDNAVFDVRALRFFHKPRVVTPSTRVYSHDHQAAFSEALNRAVAILTAAREANPRQESARESPFIHIDNTGATATAEASSSTRVTIEISSVELRTVVAQSPGLSNEERGEIIGAIPDDDEPFDIETADKLLSIATRTKDLCAPILSWVLTHIDKINWPG